MGDQACSGAGRLGLRPAALAQAFVEGMRGLRVYRVLCKRGCDF